MTTINQLPQITNPTGGDSVLLQSVSGVTGRVTIDQISDLLPTIQVNTSNVAAAGALMNSYVSGTGYVKKINASSYTASSTIPATDISGAIATSITSQQVSVAGAMMTNFFTGTSGYMRKTATSSFDVTTAIPAASITGLGTLATTSTQASAISYLNLGTLAQTSTAASGRSFLGFTTLGTNLVVNSTTQASAQSYLGLSTLATTSTAASAKSFIGLASTTTDNAIALYTGTAGNTQNSSIIVESAASIYGYQGKLNIIPSSTYTLVSSDTGKVLMITAAVTCSVTFPNSMQPGFNATIIQQGSGVVQFTAATSTTIWQRQSFTKTAGQYAAAGLIVAENSNGTAARYILSGDLA